MFLAFPLLAMVPPSSARRRVGGSCVVRLTSRDAMRQQSHVGLQTPKALDPESESRLHKLDICQVDGKGLGVMAKQNLQLGEHVFEESPLIVLPSRSQFDSSTSWEDEVSSVMAHVHDCEVLKRFWKLHDAHRCFGKEKTAPGIVLTNGVAFPSCTEGERTAIFATAACFNHSCDPNVAFTFNDANDLVVFAIKDVLAGEELCISYVDVYQSHFQRGSKLHARYGFTCRCSVCELIGAELSASDDRRERLSAIRSAVTASELDVSGNPLGDIEPLFTEIDQLLEQEFEGSPFYKVPFYCALSGLAKTLQLADRAAHLAAQSARLAFGSDADCTERTAKRAAALSSRLQRNWFMRTVLLLCAVMWILGVLALKPVGA
eukprot:TRINITY_DN110370_c0_g1_i1.p1 TRINITY_DN110370_c0_g1~~TRINITY_DN110370_c0_g1_i1.p1  ORF type:complete len:376 (+),score=54.55 TRINITY_DN110370_c0_g1_i1:142-1269(+)